MSEKKKRSQEPEVLVCVLCGVRLNLEEEKKLRTGSSRLCALWSAFDLKRRKEVENLRFLFVAPHKCLCECHLCFGNFCLKDE